VVWGVSAAVSAAFESALLAEVEGFPGPQAGACSRAADVGALLPRRTPLVAVPDDTGNRAGRTALPAERARRPMPGGTRRRPRISSGRLRSCRDSGISTDGPPGRPR
jgi:hypothetical protein